MCKYKFQGSLCKAGSLLPGRKSLQRFLLILANKVILKSWFTNLDQMPLNHCQRLPAPYK